MGPRSGAFWIIDGKLYVRYYALGAELSASEVEANEACEGAYRAKCEQWDAAHPDGYAGVTDPDAPENHVPGGEVHVGKQGGKVSLSVDPGVDHAFLPAVMEAFGVKANDTELRRNGHKWPLFEFETWCAEHPDWRPARLPQKEER